MAAKRLPPRLPAPVALIDPAEARAIVDAFFDALGHFAGEAPALDELSRVLSPDAEIVEEGAGVDPKVERYARDAWFERVEGRSRPELGQFFEEVECTITERASELRFGTLIEERVTRGGAVESVGELHCALDVRVVDSQATIVRVKVCRRGLPAPEDAARRGRAR